jgi:hypothetical protein
MRTIRPYSLNATIVILHPNPPYQRTRKKRTPMFPVTPKFPLTTNFPLTPKFPSSVARPLTKILKQTRKKRTPMFPVTKKFPPTPKPTIPLTPDLATKKTIHTTTMQAKQINPLKAAIAATPTANQDNLQTMILQIVPLHNYT